MKSDFMIGVGVGVGWGLLFARQSGEKTRAEVRKIVREGLDKSASAAATLATRAKEAALKGKERVADAVGAGKQVYRSQVAGG